MLTYFSFLLSYLGLPFIPREKRISHYQAVYAAWVYIGLDSLRNEAEIRSSRASPGESRQGACNALNRDAGSWIVYPLLPERPRPKRRCQRLCEVSGSGAGVVPLSEASEAVSGDPRCSVDSCEDSISGMRSRAAASKRRCSRSLVFASDSWCSRDSIRSRSSFSTGVRRSPTLSGSCTSVDTHTYTRPSSPCSDSRFPLRTRCLTPSGEMPKCLPASLIVIRCTLTVSSICIPSVRTSYRAGRSWSITVHRVLQYDCRVAT